MVTSSPRRPGPGPPGRRRSSRRRRPDRLGADGARGLRRLAGLAGGPAAYEPVVCGDWNLWDF